MNGDFLLYLRACSPETGKIKKLKAVLLYFIPISLQENTRVIQTYKLSVFSSSEIGISDSIIKLRLRNVGITINVIEYKMHR